MQIQSGNAANDLKRSRVSVRHMHLVSLCLQDIHSSWIYHWYRWTCINVESVRQYMRTKSLIHCSVRCPAKWSGKMFQCCVSWASVWRQLRLQFTHTHTHTHTSHPTLPRVSHILRKRQKSLGFTIICDAYLYRGVNPHIHKSLLITAKGFLSWPPHQK